MLGGHAACGLRHVVPLATSIAGVYVLPGKPALTGMWDIGRES